MNIKLLPEVGDLVVVKITEVKNFGANGILEEYPGVEGYIHISEVATGWVKHIRSYLREGQRVVCKVINVNQERKNVDLSLKRVNQHQSREKIAEWKNEQKADKLFEIVCSKLNKDLEACKKEFGVRLVELYGTLFAAFESAAAAEGEWLPDINGDWKDTFVEVAKENITIPEVSVAGYFEAYSLASDGVEKIKEVLTIPPEIGKAELEYVGAPRYRIVVRDKDYKKAEETLKKIVQSVTDKAKKLQVELEFSRQ
ncbi:translation initiation factor eIF2 alpha subunit [Thermoplasma volcanium GSS1]|uniref:Translation initiation factor 2 subunit alpha n=1 Tax=Thermoplasma volcanium (strain ATCC 51530 / DSM 4299 / JCM 9571 / NBRC 15438 / GSS1) TaxID=273116 RepID=IF2A_THEVO|nr:translation initiation factor IF-2 subunit alpha [Thermoplasma volcanium]Q97BP2.1 RecName: Full=Translation initiation factor 2 subunit alpha; AltName: Full=aIF2-alpha; AltName: Full=eIF-2-alpha [Thermoplasma volcanium GSS1]BAB59555.1 translation initiation factor eIF2 alpha subunit [Thermoplasma volcanium GSS1]